MESESDKWTEEDGVRPLSAYTTNLKVVLDKKVWDNIFGWCRAAKTECSGMGLVKKEGGTFRVYEAFLPEQKCTIVGTKITPKGRTDMMTEIARRKLPGSELKFWWHTHSDFRAFWSTTDVANIDTLVQNKDGWLLSMVINQMGEYECRLDVTNPVRIGIEELAVSVESPRGRSTRKHREDVSRKVTAESFVGQAVSGLSSIKAINDLFKNRESDDKIFPRITKGGTYVWNNGTFRRIDEQDSMLSLQEAEEGIISDD